MCGYFWCWGNFCEKSNFSSYFSSLWRVFCSILCFLSLRAVFANSIKLQLARENPPPLKKVIISTLLVTLANPHVYLDTVFLVGSAALNFSFDEKILFALGALSASFLWFFFFRLWG